LIPPNLFIVLAMIGVVLAWRTKRLGLVVATASISCLYLLSMPVVAYLLIRSTEKIPGDPPAFRSDAPPGAIVVLSVDARRCDVPGEPDTVGPLTLERLAEAARQQRCFGLPILVSGGPPDDDQGRWPR
jgi:uncharacterized SAM-binding protein YcdF (DUF218 family)